MRPFIGSSPLRPRRNACRRELGRSALGVSRSNSRTGRKALSRRRSSRGNRDGGRLAKGRGAPHDFAVVRTDDAHALALFDGERHIAKNRVVIQSYGEILDHEDGHGRFNATPGRRADLEGRSYKIPTKLPIGHRRSRLGHWCFEHRFRIETRTRDDSPCDRLRRFFGQVMQQRPFPCARIIWQC